MCSEGNLEIILNVFNMRVKKSYICLERNGTWVKNEYGGITQIFTSRTTRDHTYPSPDSSSPVSNPSFF